MVWATATAKSRNFIPAIIRGGGRAGVRGITFQPRAHGLEHPRHEARELRDLRVPTGAGLEEGVVRGGEEADGQARSPGNAFFRFAADSIGVERSRPRWEEATSELQS